MESAFYTYIEIRPPRSGTGFDIGRLRDFLNGLEELQQEDGHNYKNTQDHPFLSVFLAYVNDYDSWSSLDVHETTTNFIIITGSKKDGITPPASIITCRKIAQFMNWLLMEETDDGHQLIWSP